jgi:hypothetical protein
VPRAILALAVVALAISAGGRAAAEPLPASDAAASAASGAVSPSSPPPPAAIVAPAAAAAPGAPEASRRRLLIAPIAAGALSIAALAVGGGLLIDVAARYPALDRQCQYGCLPSDVATLDQRERAGQALLVIGAAGLVLDAVQIALALRRPAAPPPRLVLVPTASGVAASGSF